MKKKFEIVSVSQVPGGKIALHLRDPEDLKRQQQQHQMIPGVPAEFTMSLQGIMQIPEMLNQAFGPQARTTIELTEDDFEQLKRPNVGEILEVDFVARPRLQRTEGQKD